MNNIEITNKDAIIYLQDYVDNNLNSSYVGGVVTPSIRLAIQALKQVECLTSKANVIEVVRCKDCKHKGYCCRHTIRNGDNWFCADGVRRENDLG